MRRLLNHERAKPNSSYSFRSWELFFAGELVQTCPKRLLETEIKVFVVVRTFVFKRMPRFVSLKKPAKQENQDVPYDQIGGDTQSGLPGSFTVVLIIMPHTEQPAMSSASPSDKLHLRFRMPPRTRQLHQNS